MIKIDEGNIREPKIHFVQAVRGNREAHIDAILSFLPEKILCRNFDLSAKAPATASRPEVIKTLGYCPSIESPLLDRNLGSGPGFPSTMVNQII